MKNIKNIIIGFSVILSGCTSLQETPNRLVQTQFDFYCRSETCDVARNHLYDHKLLANEKKDIDTYKYTYSGKKIIEALNAEYKEKSLNTECMKVAQKLIDDRYKGCLTNKFDLPAHDAGDRHYQYESSPKGWYWGKIHGVSKDRTGLTSQIHHDEFGERQCAIEMSNQVRQFATICESTFWEEHPDTASFLKEMADDGILQTGIVRSSMSFDTFDPKNNNFVPQFGDEEELPKEAEIRLAANPVYYHTYIEDEYDDGLPMETTPFDVAHREKMNARLISDILKFAKFYIQMLDPYGMIIDALQDALHMPVHIPIPTKCFY